MPKPFQDSLVSSLAPVGRAATGWEPPRQPCSSWDGPECPVQVAESSCGGAGQGTLLRNLSVTL